MDAVNNSTGSSATHITIEKGGSAQSKGPWKIFSLEATKAAVEEEIKRMTQLPVNSAYVSHRLRVLNKIILLISLQWELKDLSVDIISGFAIFVLLLMFILCQRTTSQDKELELLFAGLSL